jgi:hypothetical protein
MLIKNLGRHSLPPLRRISSRDSINKIIAISFHHDKGYNERQTSPLTRPNIGNSDGTRGTRCIPYCLIAVHEGAGGECAHEQLIADKFHLRHRGTSIPVSSEATRTLLRTEAWVSAWCESLLRPTSEPFLDVANEGEETACLVRHGTNGRDGLVAGWPRLAGGRTRAAARPSLDGYEALVSVVLGKGLPFNDRSSLQWSSKPAGVSDVYNTELDNGPPVRSRRYERSCGRRWQSGVTASYGRGTARYDVQRSEESALMGRITGRAQCISILSSRLQLRKSWQRFPSIPGFSLARFR